MELVSAGWIVSRQKNRARVPEHTPYGRYVTALYYPKDALPIVSRILSDGLAQVNIWLFDMAARQAAIAKQDAIDSERIPRGDILNGG